MTPETHFDQLRSRLRGAHVTDRLLAASSLSFSVSSSPAGDKAFSIWFDCPWRLTGPTGLLAGSVQAQDEENDSGSIAVARAVNVVVGQTIEDLKIDSKTGDLVISLSNNLEARTLASDARDEMLWWIRDRSRGLDLSGSPAGLRVDAAA